MSEFTSIEALYPEKPAFGKRNTAGTALSEDEIDFITSEIKRIKADELVFVFNDPERAKEPTCYDPSEDRIFVTRNVFPDTKLASANPRDTMSVGAVLAREYYGHRECENGSLAISDDINDSMMMISKKKECRASLIAAQTAPDLTTMERRDLVLDAVYQAQEVGLNVVSSRFMKELIFATGTEAVKLPEKIEEPVYAVQGS